MRFQIQPCATHDQLISLFGQMARLRASLPDHKLTALDRRELGGSLIPDGAGLVRTVAVALQGHPGLYPDLPVTGEDLDTQQRCASISLALRNGFRAMAEMANDAYLVLQAGAIRNALSVVRTVHGQDRFQLDGKDLTSDRNAALVAAYFLVDAYHQALNKKKAASKAARLSKAGSAPPPAPKPPTATQKRRKQQDRKDRLARFHGEFRRFLEQQSQKAAPAAPATPASPAVRAPLPPSTPPGGRSRHQGAPPCHGPNRRCRQHWSGRTGSGSDEGRPRAEAGPRRPPCTGADGAASPAAPI